MVVKKKTETEFAQEERANEDIENQVDNNATAIAEPVGDSDGFCVYLGPSIRGVIQEGMVIKGSCEQAKAFLAPALENYPLIAKLLSSEKTIAEDRIKVKTAGNLLNVYYMKLATGK